MSGHVPGRVHAIQRLCSIAGILCGVHAARTKVHPGRCPEHTKPPSRCHSGAIERKIAAGQLVAATAAGQTSANLLDQCDDAAFIRSGHAGEYFVGGACHRSRKCYVRSYWRPETVHHVLGNGDR